MQWTVFLLALSATLSSISSQKCPDELESPLIFPDGTLPDLVPVPVRCRKNAPKIRQPETRGSCEASCKDLQKAETGDDEWRLNRDVIPSHYDLQLDVHVDTFQFNGTVEITVSAKRPTETITLHADALSIKESPEIFKKRWWPSEKEKWGSVLSVTEDEMHLTVTFHLSKALEAGQTYFLKVEYSGEIRKDLLGFYRSSYKVGDETRWLATTQFEPTHARRAFPCFDEPNFKATFEISITHDKKYKALSNMPIEKTVSNGDRQTDKFQKTPIMSTYLIAFIISDFHKYKISEPMSSIWASEDFIKDAEYSQKKGIEALKELEKFTGIKFSLPKIEHVGIPDFNAGAMENWGLITYRDYLLIKRKDSNTPTKQYIPGVIAHELAHQWFGDLVTLDWWSYTWLNEGFATFFEFYITDIIEDKFALWNQFIPSKFQVAMDLDGNPETSVAMSRHVSTPEDIAGKFDQISYGKEPQIGQTVLWFDEELQLYGLSSAEAVEKAFGMDLMTNVFILGGCILRMISELLTLGKFKQGLTNYLTKKQFKNAEPSDLFEEWEKVSSGVALPQGTTFTHFAESWTEKSGVPVVNAVRNYETGEVTFTQQRYWDKKPGCACGEGARWWIPLTWISQKDNSHVDKFKPEAWLRADVPTEEVVKNVDIEPGQWFLLNPRSVGYYRVNYDTKNWLLLSKNLAKTPQSFPTQNRAQIINDAFLLASSNQLDFAVALGTLNFLPGERDTSVWMSAIKIISRLVDEMGSTEAYPLLEEYWKKVLSDVYFTVGLKPVQEEQHLLSLLRYYVGPFACLFGVEQCKKDATENFKNFIQDPNNVHPDVVTPTLCGAVKGANEETFWKIRNQVDNLVRSTDQALVLSAMGKCYPNNKLIKQHLEDALKENSKLPKYLKMTAIASVVEAPSKFSVGFDFIKENLDKLVNNFGKDNTTALVMALIKRVRTESQYNQLNEWLKANVNNLFRPEIVTAALTAAKENTQWNTLHLSDVTDWLAATLGLDPPAGIPNPPPPTESPAPPPNSTTATNNTGNVVFTKAVPLMTAIALSLANYF